MKEETNNWIRRAEKDLRAAKNSFISEDYEWTIFQCQQAAEKSLKAFILEKTGKLRKIQDLVQLNKNVNLPENLLERIKELTLAYVYARYPDVEQKIDLKEKSVIFLEAAEEVLKWTKKNL